MRFILKTFDLILNRYAHGLLLLIILNYTTGLAENQIPQPLAPTN